MSLEYTEIYPKIFVYKNPWKDLDLITKTIIDSEEDPNDSILSDWNSWYTFGKEVMMLSNKPETERTKKELDVWNEIIDVFYKTTEHYSTHFGIPVEPNKKVWNEVENCEMDLWKRMGPSICKYEINGGIEHEKLAMHYHTDYQIEHEEMRGYKFAITCTMYLNDNYEGGELDFLVNNKLFEYKPTAGDVIVFPAGDPHYLSDDGELYFHGVNKVSKNPKYFIRNNWTWFYPGSKEWLEKESLYGKEIWAEMEFERKKKERSSGAYMAINPDNLIGVERIK